MDGEAPVPEVQAQDPAAAQAETPVEDAPAVDLSAPAGGLEMGQDGLPVPTPEEKKEEEVVPPEVIQNLQNVWSVFDIQKTHSVAIKHLRTILRALDYNLTDEELAIVTKQVDPEGTGVIKYANMMTVVEDKMKDKDTAEVMMAELRLLDRDKDEKIPVPEFKQFMMNMG